MTTRDGFLPPSHAVARAPVVAGVGVALLIAVAGLSWSKWMPYASRLGAVAASGTYPGSDILAAGGVRPGDLPSWHAATSFTVTYGLAVWKALVAALLLSAALQVLVPRRWLLGLLDRPHRLGAALAGGLVATPSMMCTCCTAPVAATLRGAGSGPRPWWRTGSGTRCSTPPCWRSWPSSRPGSGR